MGMDGSHGERMAAIPFGDYTPRWVLGDHPPISLALDTPYASLHSE
jgi:hypothetical protein